MHEGVVARRYRPLLEIYLIPIKEVLKKVDKVLKTRGMCIKAVEKYLWLLKYVPDYFVTHQQIKIWHDNDDYCNDDELIEWYEGYQKHRAHKAQIKKEVLPIAWHPSRWWGWCVPEDEKQETKKLWA